MGYVVLAVKSVASKLIDSSPVAERENGGKVHLDLVVMNCRGMAETGPPHPIKHVRGPKKSFSVLSGIEVGKLGF